MLTLNLLCPLHLSKVGEWEDLESRIGELQSMSSTEETRHLLLLLLVGVVGRNSTKLEKA